MSLEMLSKHSAFTKVGMEHSTLEELEAGLEEIRQSPQDEGVLRLIVRRPQTGAREVLEEGELHLTEGLVGDNWSTRRSSPAPGGAPDPEMQLNVVNARVIALVAREESRWGLAGDQLFIDLDLSAENLPSGTQLAVGSAVIEVTARPHAGCHKFAQSFGVDAMKFVNSPLGRQFRLRGINAKVVRRGVIRVGDSVKKTRGR